MLASIASLGGMLYLTLYTDHVENVDFFWIYSVILVAIVLNIVGSLTVIVSLW